MSVHKRKAMLEPGSSDLSLSRQCKILSISRSTAYYQPKGESPATLALMRRIYRRVYAPLKPAPQNSWEWGETASLPA